MAEQTTKRERDPNEIGALWRKTSQGGQKYFWGKLTIDDKDILIVAFKNSFQKNDTQPAYVVKLANNQGDRQTAQPAQTQPVSKQVARPTQKAKPAPAQLSESEPNVFE